jgi:tyrosyl-tRNA synthetase
MKQNFVEELRWRGMLQDMMPGTEEQLTKEATAAYLHRGLPTRNKT